MVKRRLLLLPALVVGFLIVTSPPAAADTVDRTSQPNHDISITLSSGSADSDKDGDGDFNTVSNGETAVVYMAVFNNSETAQTVHVDLRLDGPGTAQDDAFTADLDLAADGGNRQGNVVAFKVHKTKTPKGPYTSTLTASGSEEVSATSTFTVL